MIGKWESDGQSTNADIIIDRMWDDGSDRLDPNRLISTRKAVHSFSNEWQSWNEIIYTKLNSNLAITFPATDSPILDTNKIRVNDFRFECGQNACSGEREKKRERAKERKKPNDRRCARVHSKYAHFFKWKHISLECACERGWISWCAELPEEKLRSIVRSVSLIIHKRSLYLN